MDLNQYLDRAKVRLGTTSDRQLGKAIGLTPIMVNQYRRRGYFPSDETMVRLAEVAGIDAGEALLDLSEWRAKAAGGHNAAAAYARLRSMLKVGTAAMLALAIASVGGAATAATTDSEQIRLSGSSLYIMR